MADQSESAFVDQIRTWKLQMNSSVPLSKDVHLTSGDNHHSRRQSDEGIDAKLVREAYLLRSSLIGGIDKGFEEAKEDPVGTAARVGTAVVAGFVLAKVTSASRCLAELSTAANVGLTTSALFDLAHTKRLARISDALCDAWTSNINIQKDREILESELGRFAYDSVLATLVAAFGTTTSGILRTHHDFQSHAFKPTARGSITYDFGAGITYKVGPHDGVLRSGILSVQHTPQRCTPSFSCGKSFDGKDVTRFSNGDKLINEFWWRTTIDTGKTGNKRIQIKYHDADVTINEGQTAGKWNDRSLTYGDWLKVREYKDGTLKISAQGNHRGFFKPPELSGVELLQNKMRLPNFHSPLPHRPKVSSSPGDGHEVEFASGARLLVDGSDLAVLKNGKNTTLIHREMLGDKVSTPAWQHFIQGANDYPK